MAITQTSHALQHGFGISAGALERCRLAEHRLRILRGRDAARLHLISQLRSRSEQIHQQIIPVQHALHVLRRRVTEVALDNTRHVLGGGMPQLVRQRAARREIELVLHTGKVRAAEYAVLRTCGGLQQCILRCAVAFRQGADTGDRCADRAQRVPAQHLTKLVPQVLTELVGGFAHSFLDLSAQQEHQPAAAAEKGADLAFLAAQTLGQCTHLLLHGIFRQAHDAHKILLRCQQQPPAFSLYSRLRSRHAAREQVVEKMLTQHVLLVFAAAVCTFRAKLLLLLLNLLGNLSKRFKQLRRADRLEQIRVRVQRNRLLCILKFIVSAEEHNTQPRHGAPHNLCQLQTIHKRHADIRNEHIRLHFHQHRQCHFAIRRFTCKQKALLLLFNAVADAIPDDLLIIRNKYTHHSVFPSCSSGTVKLMRVPCRYSLSIVSPQP